MDFLIYYETVPREYENACLMKAELERRGYSVKIANTIRRDYWWSRFCNPKVTIIPSISSNSEINQYINKNRPTAKAKVIDLRYEQVVWKDNSGHSNKLPRQNARHVYRICWGSAAFNELKETGIDEKYLIQTGAIQLDLARKEFSDYFLDRERIAQEFQLDPNKKWILFTSTLAYGMMSEEWIKERATAHGKPLLIPYAAYMRKVVSLLQGWLSRFLEENPDVIYIYRPHPSEPISDAFKSLTEKYPNFRIIRDYSVKQWFHVVDLVNTWNSTSILEAYFCQKPCCVIDIDETGYEQFRIEIVDSTKIIHNYADFAAFNQDNQVFCEETFPLNKAAVEAYYGKDHPIPVYYRLCDFFETVLKNDDYYETFSMEITDDLRDFSSRYRFMTLRGDIMLLTFPFINKLIPSKCKIDHLLAQHETKRLKDMERRIKKQVGVVSRQIEARK